MSVGEWEHPHLGIVKISTADLHRFVENFRNNVRGVNLFVDLSHKAEEGAVGEFKELQVRGNQLWANVVWTEEGERLIKSGKYNYFSPEFVFSWKDPATGQLYKDVLFGGALTNRPFLKHMERIALSESAEMFQVQFADGETYDPNHDNDDDSTTDPARNPDWMMDVLAGITKWPDNRQQQEQLRKKGAKKAACDAAYDVQHRASSPQMTTGAVGMSEPGGITNSHKSPPKGKPTNKALYADPENYKYPIDRKNIHAAVGYFNHDGMQQKGGYSDSEWVSIGHRIAEAANKLLGAGYSFKDGKIITPSTHKMDESGGYDPDANPDDGTSTPHPTDDTDPGQFSDPTGGVKFMDGITLEDWTAAQSKIKALEESERRHKFTEVARGWLFSEQTNSGKLLPAQQDKVVDLMMSLSDDQVAKFTEFVEGLPDAISFGEIGTSGVKGTGKNGEADSVLKLAEKYERDDHMSFHDAFIRASTEMGVK